MQAISKKYGLVQKDYVYTHKYMYDEEVSVSSYLTKENRRCILECTWKIPQPKGVLICIGKNPSKAGCVIKGKFHKSDKTFNIVVKIAIANNYNGVIFVNMSSLISTNFNPIITENIRHVNTNKDILKTILSEGLDVYCYWGVLPSVLKKKMLLFVLQELRLRDLSLYCSGVNKCKSPRHIGRGSYDCRLTVFTEV